MRTGTITTDDAAEAGSGSRHVPASREPVVIEARNISKTFRIPEQKVDTLKERFTHPLRRVGYRELHALRDVSFDIHRGEFFGIVGRNGSGKSTLLKILAGIYGADTGRVRMAGRMAPFIELGVGFNPELSARENVALNGVLMGLSRREARRRLAAVIDFAELHDFVDLRVKNYSSGMMVRLAFSIMIQADPDIMLIDEVLAVGDAAFGQKCMDVFYERRDAGKTVVLVTHDMSTVASLCHRAMVIEDGTIQHIGEPEETAIRYYRLNFAQEVPRVGELHEEGKPPAEREVTVDLNARLVRSRLTNEAGQPVANLEQGQPIVLDVVFEAARELEDPIFVLHLRNEEGTIVFESTRRFTGRAAKGQRIRLSGSIDNRLVPGSYMLQCWIRRDRVTGDMALQGVRLAQFVVFGTAPRHGLVLLENDLEAVLEEETP